MPGSLIKLKFQVNEEPVLLQCPPARRLIDLLRQDLGLTGTREGCGRGECGACLVLLNGEAVNSCLVPAFTVVDAEIYTIEGIRKSKAFAELRRLLPEPEAFRCKFCSSGMQVALAALLLASPVPAETELRTALAGNL